MDRHYVPLRSAPPVADEDAATTFEPPKVKRRRVGVSVACNACRRRKVRCDGQRPVCTNCLGQTSQCAYRDESDLSHESRKIVVEIVRILNSIPAAEAMRTLRLLSTETNAPVILSTLRDEGRARSEPSTDSNMASKSENISQLLEFEAQNPTAYPSIPPFDHDHMDLENQPYARRSESAIQVSSSCSELHSEEDNPLSSKPSYEMAHNPFSRSSSINAGDRVGTHRQASPLELCDPRLRELNIQNWTEVEIDNDTAAKCISLYLETDHPLLGHFDSELFISNLVSNRSEYCSPLLVNALLYWASQMYSYIDPKTDALAMSFCTEAERLWAIELSNGRDSIMNAAAAEFLCLGYLGQGRDHAISAYISEASNMGLRMGLFGIETKSALKGTNISTEMVDEATRARMHAAWGLFNWITLMSLFYRQPGLSGLRHPPRIAIPEYKPLDDSADTPSVPTQSTPVLQYMGETFPHICRFWFILHEVSLAYNSDDKLPWGSGSSLLFAEFKFRELLAWSNNLPSRLSQSHRNPHHVQILHLWFHAAILDIFRPHVGKRAQDQQHLRTFSNKAITPDAVCDASVAQLKHLISDYRLNYKSSAYTFLWHTALIYVINAILDGNKEENWYSDLLICIYAYESLGRSWRVASGIAKGLLSLAMRKSDIPSRTARRILGDLERNHADQFEGPIRATFMADLSLALSDPASATVERLAEQFEDNVLLKDYTTSFDVE